LQHCAFSSIPALYTYRASCRDLVVGQYVESWLRSAAISGNSTTTKPSVCVNARSSITLFRTAKPHLDRRRRDASHAVQTSTRPLAATATRPSCAWTAMLPQSRRTAARLAHASLDTARHSTESLPTARDTTSVSRALLELTLPRCACMRVYVCVFVCVCIYIMYVCMYIYMNISMYAHTYICMQSYVHDSQIDIYTRMPSLMFSKQNDCMPCTCLGFDAAHSCGP
jgi:hypothetical protein